MYRPVNKYIRSQGRGGATDLELWGTFYKLASGASQKIFLYPTVWGTGTGTKSKSVGYNGHKKLFFKKRGHIIGPIAIR